MTFLEAIDAVRVGKRIGRPTWSRGWYLGIANNILRILGSNSNYSNDVRDVDVLALDYIELPKEQFNFTTAFEYMQRGIKCRSSVSEAVVLCEHFKNNTGLFWTTYRGAYSGNSPTPAEVAGMWELA
jgi:hypothetical protein